MANMLAIQFLIFSLVLFSESSAIRVKVTYDKNANDVLTFTTTDISICSRYNARYVRRTSYEVRWCVNAAISKHFLELMNLRNVVQKILVYFTVRINILFTTVIS